MANIFSKMKDYVDKPNRNTFDLSFQNNLTMGFGKLYPVFCKEVIPGDSFRIKPSFGLRFMPLVFPIQTRMQANLHFFYVRNRNLWKDWTDFIGDTKKNLSLPYLSSRVAKKVCKTGGLGDYLGLPTTIAGDYGSIFLDKRDQMLFSKSKYALGSGFCSYIYTGFTGEYTKFSDMVANTIRYIANPSSVENPYPSCLTSPFSNGSYRSGETSPVLDFCFIIDNNVDAVNFNLGLMSPFGEDDWQEITSSSEEFAVVLPMGEYSNPDVTWLRNGASVGSVVLLGTDTVSQRNMYKVTIRVNDFNFGIGTSSSFNLFSSELSTYLVSQYGSDIVRLLFYSANSGSARCIALPSILSHSQNWFGFYDFTFPRSSEDNYDLGDVSDSLNPFATGDLKVSALPFRAYESIYNAFYRNQFNDPFILNGQKEYNKFISNDEGGEDNTDYDLLLRNYEQDFLTSARQSPVDGDITPLVGVTGTGTFTFQNADGSQVNITPEYAEDGTTIIGIKTVDGTPENTSSIRRLMDMASVGISINDFRNVNALQRWLETNLRRGYRYKDQLLSHFGVEAKFDVLDMPEFIGGMSEPVLVNQINQSVDQTGDPSGLGDFSKVLGSFAGQASILAQSSHDIEKYCDEHGFIIGILSITPVPNYSQLLPKHFTKFSVLDYYYPEFAHIGNQPIPYTEVCPLQSYAEGDPLTDVFGYQRAWYDYLASVDETHGDFRTSLEGFLINRVFKTRPELGHDFLSVSEDDMTNPFSVTDEGDKILGQIYFEVTAQRPIPKFGIPRLE